MGLIDTTKRHTNEDAEILHLHTEILANHAKTMLITQSHNWNVNEYGRYERSVCRGINSYLFRVIEGIHNLLFANKGAPAAASRHMFKELNMM